MRHSASVVLIFALGTFASACSIQRAPGATWSNIYAMNTENVGEWRVLDRQVTGDAITLRVAAQYPERAQAIARRAIDQQLDRSPREVTVAVYPMEEGAEGTPAARITWTRPDNIAGIHVPRPIDVPSSANRVGGPADAAARQ
jgi:hypothetical protein